MENYIIHRLEKLERENRRMKKIGAVIAVLVCILLVSGQAKSNKIVEANEFRLVDASGKVRAELSMVLTEPSLSFKDGNGDQVVALGTYGGFPNLSLGKDKAWRVFLAAGELPGSSLSLIPPEGQHGAATISVGTQSSFLSVFGPTGSVSVNTDEDQGPSLTVKDKEGYSINLGRAELEVIGTGRKERTPAASVVLFGKDKKVLWSAP